MNSTQYKKILPFLLLVLAQLFSNAQATDSQFTSSDSTFTIELSRKKSEVDISLVLHKNLSFDHISIERKANDESAFHQCKYIDQQDLKSGEANLSRKDMYPAPATADVQYRLKIVSAGGETRIYPAVMLSAVTHKL